MSKKRRQRNKPTRSKKSSDQLVFNLPIHPNPNEAKEDKRDPLTVKAKGTARGYLKAEAMVYRLDDIHKERELLNDKKYIRAIIDLVRHYK